MSAGLTVTKPIHFSLASKGKREIKPGHAPIRDTPDGRIPRIARLMALALRFEDLLAKGAVRDQAEVAELGHVTPARVTQIMNLLLLAPDIQEAILFLPRVTEGKDRLAERSIRRIVAEPDWTHQRLLWQRICKTS